MNSRTTIGENNRISSSSSAAAAPVARASLLVLGMAAFMVQADARVIDPLLFAYCLIARRGPLGMEIRSA